jgi:7,8-dihydro-6-hydroxymethylpterin-pyrophosphokinase
MRLGAKRIDGLAFGVARAESAENLSIPHLTVDQRAHILYSLKAEMNHPANRTRKAQQHNADGHRVAACGAA